MRELKISPIEFRDYAKSLGWTIRQDSLQDRLYVMENRNFPRRQLVIPINDTVPDYQDSLNIAFEKLADMASMNHFALYEKIRSSREDMIKFRIFSEVDQDKSLPLDFVSQFIKGTQQLLKSAACTVMRPRIYHPRLALTEAIQLVEKSSFGHTEPGSFVMKISCPIDALDTQGVLTFDERDTPFVRRVMTTIKQGLEGLVAAIEQDSLDNFINNIKNQEAPIVSSNLCEAITYLQDERLHNSIDVNFNWSVARSSDGVPNAQRIIRIQRDYFGRIEDVRRELRANEQAQADTFIGTVESLNGEMGDDGRRSGDVILALLLREGETIKARVALNADHYLVADRAHMTEGAYIRVCGTLHPGRQPRQLLEISSFEQI